MDIFDKDCFGCLGQVTLEDGSHLPEVEVEAYVEELGSESKSDEPAIEEIQVGETTTGEDG